MRHRGTYRYIEGGKRQTKMHRAREVHDRAKPDHSRETDEMLGVDLTQKKGRSKECWVGNVSTRCKGVRGFRSALLKHELAQNGARGFGVGNECSGRVLMTQE